MSEVETLLTVEQQDAVAVVTLDRPERLNALSHALLVRLREELARLEADGAVRAVVLTGAGRAFSSGADLRGGPSDAEDVVRRLYNPLVTDLLEMATPLIAALNGVAAGAAVSLALACDLRVAAASARLQLSFVNVGLVPDAGATWLLPRLVGAGRAAEMALLGRAVFAEEALTWGLINRVAPDGECLAMALELARTIAAASGSTGPIRRLLHSTWSNDFATQIDAEATSQGHAQGSADYAEARLAFSERRAPVFTRT